ncbi:hypothetical protein LTS15_008110 [Exophiala xenobiotica]|nr:hypothetical protein LTS15_008110 [Exophiala xenobiotica]
MAVRSFYSKRRREHVLEVFQNGRVRDLQMTLPSPVDDGQNGGKGYILRRQSVFRAGQSGVWNEASEDEYNPDAKRKRRSMGVGGNGAKPLKRQRLNQGIAAKAQHEATVEQGGRVPSLVTFKFEKDRSKTTLRDLADRHGNGYEAKTGEGPNLVEETSILQEILPHDRDMQLQDMRGPTYLEKLDQESANIDNVDGRVLRSRKILIREDFDTRVQKTYACSPVKIAPAISGSKSEAPLERTQHTILPGERPAVASVPTAVQIIRSSVTTPQYPLIRQVGSSMTDPIILDDSPPGSPVSSGPAATLKQITNSGTNVIILDQFPPRPPVSSGPAAASKKITTCWAHPINFQHLKTNGSDCDFCRDFRFGIYGYGRITVDVIQHPNSALHEIGKGHCSTGKGCGLKLCEDCTTKVMSCGGSLRKDSIMQAGPKGLRADVEFLFSDSLLHQAYGQYKQL